MTIHLGDITRYDASTKLRETFLYAYLKLHYKSLACKSLWSLKVKPISKKNTFLLFVINQSMKFLDSLGGLGVTCLPRDPRFAGSNPTEVDEFFRA